MSRRWRLALATQKRWPSAARRAAAFIVEMPSSWTHAARERQRCRNRLCKSGNIDARQVCLSLSEVLAEKTVVFVMLSWLRDVLAVV